MTVAEALAAKEQAERQIEEILGKFQEVTGIGVRAVDLSTVEIERAGWRMKQFMTTVSLDVRL